jgi:hypothetical protein
MPIFALLRSGVLFAFPYFALQNTRPGRASADALLILNGGGVANIKYVVYF